MLRPVLGPSRGEESPLTSRGSPPTRQRELMDGPPDDRVTQLALLSPRQSNTNTGELLRHDVHSDGGSDSLRRHFHDLILQWRKAPTLLGTAFRVHVALLAE